MTAIEKKYTDREMVPRLGDGGAVIPELLPPPEAHVFSCDIRTEMPVQNSVSETLQLTDSEGTNLLASAQKCL